MKSGAPECRSDVVSKTFEKRVHHRNDYQGQHRGKTDAKNDHHSQSFPQLVGNGQDDDAADGREGGRENGPQSLLSSGHDGVEYFQVFLALVVDTINQNDGVIDHNASQADQSHKAHDRKIVASGDQPDHGAYNGQRQGCHDGQWLKIGIELCHQKGKDQDKGN